MDLISLGQISQKSLLEKGITSIIFNLLADKSDSIRMATSALIQSSQEFNKEIIGRSESITELIAIVRTRLEPPNAEEVEEIRTELIRLVGLVIQRETPNKIPPSTTQDILSSIRSGLKDRCSEVRKVTLNLILESSTTLHSLLEASSGLIDLARCIQATTNHNHSTVRAMSLEALDAITDGSFIDEFPHTLIQLCLDDSTRVKNTVLAILRKRTHQTKDAIYYLLAITIDQDSDGIFFWGQKHRTFGAGIDYFFLLVSTPGANDFSF